MNIKESFYCSRCLREMEDEGVCPFCGYDEDEAVYDPQVLEEGTLLHDKRYRIGALIGKGGFGMTYAAWDQTLLSAVAIKEYFPDGFAARDVDESNEVQVKEEDRLVFGVGLSNFTREAHILAALQNVEHVVKVSNCFEENGTAYIVMEYVRGVTLLEYVKEHQISTEALLKMLRKPIDALAMIHGQGVMHRDITPNNLMVQEDGTIKLIDFGAAYVDESRIKGRNYSISATRHYAAPEQYDSRLQQGQWTDVYGLSATVYALITGCQPPDSQERMKRDTLVPPRRMGKGLSKRQEQALMEGLRINPENRLRSVDEFRAILYNLPTPEIVRQRRKIMRRMTVIMAAAAALVLLLAVNFTIGFPLGEGLMYSLNRDGWHVVSMNGDQETIDVPASRLALPVSGIGEEAFAGNENLYYISLPESIEKIGSRAFYGAKALETVKIAKGTLEIGSLAFAQCPELHTIYLPATLQTIGEHAFLDTPSYLTVWGSEAIRLRTLVSDMGVSFAVRGDFEISVENGEAALTKYTCKKGKNVIPSVIDGYPVTAISDGCVTGMFDYSMTELVLPYFLLQIPDGLCDSGRKVHSVELGPYVQSIGAEAFAYTDIESIRLPDTLRVIGEEAFFGSELKAIELPDGLVEIGESAFSCTALTDIVVPASVQLFGDDAFSSIDTLISAKVCCPIETLGMQFYGCPNLKTIELPEGIRKIELLAFGGDVSLEYVVLPETVEEIDYGAFDRCINLEYIDIPPSAENINQQAFGGCSADLIIAGQPGSAAQTFADEMGYRFEDKTLYTPGLVKEGKISTDSANGHVICPTYDEATKSLIRIVDKVNGAKTGLPFTSIVLPGCATEIGFGAFSETGVQTVVLPSTLERIVSSAFEDCRKLKTINLPDGLLQIGYGAFENCVSLTEINLPEGLRILEQSAFSGCSQLTQVTIPPNVTELGAFAFTGTAIEAIVIPGTVRQAASAFENCKTLRTAVVGEGCRLIIDTFRGCTALETLSLPSTVSAIRTYDFEGCASLKDVYIYNRAAVIYTDKTNYSLDWAPKTLTESQKESCMHPFMDSAQTVTIHGYPGSTAQMYAEAFGLRFEPIEETEQ
ncbi:MAG: leucine-rich repeat protein [Clostridia bacterium]|nr:leucine-rich repeat protein [Clostridia bacterium]